MRYRYTIWLIPFVSFIGAQSLCAQPTAATPGPTSVNDHQVYVPGELFVKADPDLPQGDVGSAIQERGGTIIDKNAALGFYRVRVEGHVETAAFSLQLHPSVISARPNYVLAESQGELTTLYDVELTIQRMLPAARDRFKEMEAKERLLRTVFHDKLILHAARDENLEHDPDVVREINEAVEGTLVRIYRRRLTAASAGLLSDEAVRANYEENTEEYQLPGDLRGQCILTKTKKEAEEILELIKAGDDFGELAKERSIDHRTSQKGGSFSWLRREQMPSQLWDAGFALEEGEVTEVVRTPGGFCILKLTEKRGPRPQPFSEAKGRVKEELEDEIVEKRMQELCAKYHGRLHPEFLSEIKVTVTPQEISSSLLQMRNAINAALESPHQYTPTQ